MQISNLPSRISKPFAESGTKNTIPVASQIGVTPGAASYTDGFPPLTRTPLVAGGVPPFGEDMNGILYAISALNQWQSAGGQMTYDATFSTAIGGYPKGAVLQKSGSNGFWISTADNNTADPDAGGANWVDLFKWNVASAGGTADAITASFPLGIASWSQIAGVPLFVRAATANATTTPTFTANSGTLTAKTIVKGANASLVAGDLAGAGHWVCLQYDATLDRVVLLNPATGITSSSAASVQGTFKNLAASATGTSANITVTADEIALEDSSNVYKTVRSVSLTIAGTSTGANALDTGTIATSTWYSVWVINNGTTTAGLLSLSATSPTMPSGYTYKARVGWIRTDATGNKYPLAFKQYGRDVQYVVASGSNITALPAIISGIQGNPSTPVYVAGSVSAYAPPSAGRIRLIFSGSGNYQEAILAPNNSYGANPGASNANPPWWSVNGASNSYGGLYSFPLEMILESTNIYFASTNATNKIQCSGWVDNI